jgi:ParB/RepB/Spo0J family partition protein
MSSGITNVLLSDIHYDDVFNCRGEFTRQSVYDLAQSIKTNSLLCPLILRAGYDAGIKSHLYHLVAGHRRFKAIEWWLKWDQVPAIIHTGLTDEKAHVINLVENIEREDLTLVEQGLAIKETFPDMSLREIGEHLHRSKFWIKQRFDLIKLSPKIQDYVTGGRLTLGDVELLLRLNPSERETEVDVLLAHKQRGHPISVSVRRGRTRKTSEIKQMVARMMTGGAAGIGTKALIWATGNITDEEFETLWREWVSMEGWRDEHEDDPTEYIVDSRITIPTNRQAKSANQNE